VCVFFVDMSSMCADVATHINSKKGVMMKTVVQSMILVVFMVLLWGCGLKAGVPSAESTPNWTPEQMQGFIESAYAESASAGQEIELTGWRDTEEGRILYFNRLAGNRWITLTMTLFKVDTPQGTGYIYKYTHYEDASDTGKWKNAE